MALKQAQKKELERAINEAAKTNQADLRSSVGALMLAHEQSVASANALIG